VISVGFALGTGVVGAVMTTVGVTLGASELIVDGVSVGFPDVDVDTDGTRLGSRVVLIVGFIVGAKVVKVGLRVATRAGTVGAEVRVAGVGVASEAVSSSENETDSGNDVGSGRASSDDRGADVGLRGILVFSSLLDDDEMLEEDWELDFFVFFDEFLPEEDWELDFFVFFDEFLPEEDWERDFFVFFDDNSLLLSMCFLDCLVLLLSKLREWNFIPSAYVDKLCCFVSGAKYALIWLWQSTTQHMITSWAIPSLFRKLMLQIEVRLKTIC
jgi:hypothetical protein